MNIENPKIQECTTLWREVFGDSHEFIASFMKLFYSEENMLYIEQENKIVSMLYIIPFETDETKVAYIYAVATAPDMRGKGFAKRLIKQAVIKVRQEGYKAIFTIPTDEGLTKFYSQFGFRGRYAVKFESKENFDFGTGNRDEDFAMILLLDCNFTPRNNEITLKSI